LSAHRHMALTIITLKAGNRSSILCNIIIGSLVGETADCFDSLQLSSSLEYSFSWHAKCSLSYQHIPQNFMEIAVQNRVDENDIQCSFKACMVKIHPDTVPYNLFQYHPPIFARVCQAFLQTRILYSFVFRLRAKCLNWLIVWYLKNIRSLYAIFATSYLLYLC